MATLALPPRRTPAQSPSPPVYRSPIVEEIPQVPGESALERVCTVPTKYLKVQYSTKKNKF